MTYAVLTGVEPQWTEIGALTNDTVKPSFLTFNGKLLIADGHTGIRRWDGSTYDTIATSPPATALYEIGARVVANATDELDGVFFSAPEDEEDWDTGGSAAVTLRAGYGDGLMVNGFAAIRDILVVSKASEATTGVAKTMWTVTVTGTPDDWKVDHLSLTTAATTPHVMANVMNDVIFADDNGIYSIATIIEYGDVKMDGKFGYRVNSEVSSLDPFELKFMANYAAVWILYNSTNRVFAYHPHIGDGGAFTELTFNTEINAMLEVGDSVYLAGNAGHLYRLQDSVATDELEEGVYTYITCEMRSKLFTLQGDKGILKRCIPHLQYKVEGTLYVEAYDDTLSQAYLLGTIALESIASELFVFDATGDLYDANDLLGESSVYTGYIRQVFRDEGIMLALRSTSGSFGVSGIHARVAVVNG
jgi:hypothetical protein